MNLPTVLGCTVLAGVGLWALKRPAAELLGRLPPFPVVVALAVGLSWVAGYHRAATVVLALGTVGYVIEVVVFPWTPCRGCNATGKQWSPLSRSFKTCGKCGGLAKRIRLGRRVWTGATTINEDRK